MPSRIDSLLDKEVNIIFFVIFKTVPVVSF